MMPKNMLSILLITGKIAHQREHSFEQRHE
jgi:hypothetical protein